MFESRALAIGAIAAGDINANQRHDDFVEFARRNEHTQITRKRFVPGCSSERETEENLSVRLDRSCAEIVGVRNGADQPAAIVGDVELARQSIKGAIVN